MAIVERQESYREEEFLKLGEKLQAVFNEVIGSSKHVDLLERFHEAYKYRQQYPWLGESGTLPGERDKDGLAYALQNALALYVVQKSPMEMRLVNIEKLSEGNGGRLDPSWREALEKAVSIAINDFSSLRQFAHSLSRGGFNIETMGDALKEHVIRALDSYYKQRKIGTARDPF